MNRNSTQLPEVGLQGNQTEPQNSSEMNFSCYARRLVKTHVRRWHIGVVLAASPIIAFFYGVGNAIVLIVVGILVACVVVYVWWLTENPARARHAILTVMFIPVYWVLCERYAPELIDRHRGNDIVVGTNHHQLPTQQQPVDSLQARHERATANSAYWQIAVLGPKAVWLMEPAEDDEPAGQFYHRIFQRLEASVRSAEMAVTDQVDNDLVAMARRHLETDRRMLRWRDQVVELMERRGLPEDNVPAAERMAQGGALLLAILEDPSLLEGIEDPEARSIMGQVIDLATLSATDFHEAQIMQARLEERYAGTEIPLPDLDI